MGVINPYLLYPAAANGFPSQFRFILPASLPAHRQVIALYYK